MKFRLYKGGDLEDKVLVSENDDPGLLDYSKLQCCAGWEIQVTFDDGTVYRAARVNWLPCSKYMVYNDFGGVEVLIKHHSLIIPIVRSVIIYNWIFGAYEKVQYAKTCRVFPVCEA